MEEVEGQGVELQSALERRRQRDADIVLGALELWVGVGANQSWPWLDLAVRVGKGWGAFVDTNAPFVQRPDFVTFVPALRDFAAKKRDDVYLGSLGGSLRLILKRSEYGLVGELFLQHGPNSQTIRFSLWDESLQAAVAQAEAALERVLAAKNLGWVPPPGLIELMPRAVDIAPPEQAREFAAWDSGLGEGEDVAFQYEVDGYGWYAVTIRVGDKTGETGGSYLSDPMGDLLRAALMLLAGAESAEVTILGEPGCNVIQFDRELLWSDEPPEPGLPGKPHFGCRIRIRDFYADSTNGVLEFEGLARSRHEVAQAIYKMAHAHFEKGAGPWSSAMAALHAALPRVPYAADD